MNKDYYNINYSRLAVLLLPTMLRTKMLSALVTALVRPLALLHSKFNAYMNSINTSVASQVCYLQAALNDRCDYYDRRIFIRDAAVNYDDFFLFDPDALTAVLLSDPGSAAASWVDAGKLGTTVPDFEVVFPRGYTFTGSEEKSLRSFINANKLASKKYRITYE